jgi:hypothetical protein
VQDSGNHTESHHTISSKKSRRIVLILNKQVVRVYTRLNIGKDIGEELLLVNVTRSSEKNQSLITVTCFAERSWRDLSPSLPLAPGRVQQGKE